MPSLVTVTVVAALLAPTLVAAKLTGDGVAWNTGTRAGIVVTDQFEKVEAELHVNDTLTPSVYDSCGTTSNFSVYGNGVDGYDRFAPLKSAVPVALPPEWHQAPACSPRKRRR